MRKYKPRPKLIEKETRSQQKRDDQSTAIYMTVCHGRGLSTAEIASQNNITPETALIDLNHFVGCGLIKSRGGKWFWSKRHNPGNEKSRKLS